MIKKLRINFVAIMMGTLLVAFLALFFVLNTFMQNASKGDTEDLLRAICDTDGFTQQMGVVVQGTHGELYTAQNPTYKTMDLRTGRFFYVKVSSDGEIFEAMSNMPFALTQEDLIAYAQHALSAGGASGTRGDFQFMTQEKNYGQIIAFVERSSEARMLSQLLQISTIVAGVTLLILFVFSIFFSKWVVRPVETAFEKQQQFISDASHELKTPLTTIAAGTAVLENEIGENVQLARMKAQTTRMSELINDLLTLATTGESPRTNHAEFDLSKAVLACALEFESRAYEEGKKYEVNVAPGITYKGDEEQLRRLTAILLDNALKHAGDGGTVKLNFARREKALVLSVYNTGTGIPPEELGKIFDRFYRSDASRSRQSGGFGLGLSIARDTAHAHGGKLAAESKLGEGATFTLTL